MPATTVLRIRIDARRKARVEKILARRGLSSSQVVNLLFVEIERRKALPFPAVFEDNSDIAPTTDHIAHEWDCLDHEDFSYLDKR